MESDKVKKSCTCEEDTAKILNAYDLVDIGELTKPYDSVDIGDLMKSVDEFDFSQAVVDFPEPDYWDLYCSCGYAQQRRAEKK
jgi:hypothetical protein